MRGLANPDSKIYSILNKLAFLVELNLLVVLCSLPVITAGAAFCSMHTVLLKIYRGEESRIGSDFFRAMKENLKNGTALWLLLLLFLGLLAGVWFLAGAWIPEGATVLLLFVLLLAAVLGSLYLDWAMILQSRYVYTVPQCLRNALLAWIEYPGSTVVYLISLAVPVLLCLSLQILPLVALLGITVPHFISTTLYSRVFDRMEGIPDRIHEL